jgi:flagellar hook-length control protein FliK
MIRMRGSPCLPRAKQQSLKLLTGRQPSDRKPRTATPPVAGLPASWPIGSSPNRSPSHLRNPVVAALNPTAPAHPSPTAPASADGSTAAANDPAAAPPPAVPPAAVLPSAATDLPDPTALVPAPDQALATLAALALSALQTGLPGGPPPSAPAAVPSGAAKAEGVPETSSLGLDPVPSQAPSTTQAVLAEDPAKTKGKGPTKDLQAALEALQATPATASPMATKTGPTLPAPTEFQEAPPAMTPAKASIPAPASSLGFEPSQLDPGTTAALSFSQATEVLPSEAATAPAPATAPQHVDSSAMAALTALPRTSTPAAGSTPAAPPANTPAQPSSLATPLATQVEGGVRWMLKGGSQEAQLQLHPDSLGQVTIHLRVEGGEVHARLWVTEASSVQAVQEGRPHLEASLKEQGLQLGSFDLQQGQRPFQEAPATPNYPGRPLLEVAPAGQEAPSLPAASILNAHHVELYA